MSWFRNLVPSRKSESDFSDLLNTFLQSNEKGIQFDIFRSNKQVLLQVYRQYDVERWQDGFSLTDSKGIIIELHFHKDKTDNEENLERFKDSDLFGRFEQLSVQGQSSYFLGVGSNTPNSEIGDCIWEIINVIYSLSDERIEFTLNAY